MENKLYGFTIKVSRGEDCDLPAEMQGAYVTCYVGASDYQTAVTKGVAAVSGMGFVFEDMESTIREIPTDSWTEYVKETWPEFADNFPSQEELFDTIKKGAVFFGPFAGFRS